MSYLVVVALAGYCSLDIKNIRGVTHLIRLPFNPNQVDYSSLTMYLMIE